MSTPEQDNEAFERIEAQLISESRQYRFNNDLAVRTMWTIVSLMYAPLAGWFLMLLVPLLTAGNRTPSYPLCIGAYALGVGVAALWPKR